MNTSTNVVVSTIFLHGEFNIHVQLLSASEVRYSGTLHRANYIISELFHTKIMWFQEQLYY